MKPNHLARGLTCLVLFSLLLVDRLYSQVCANGTTVGVEIHDTSFIGDGNSTIDLSFPQYDTSRVYVRINFPQFDLLKGTLIQVDIETVINVENSYELENKVGTSVTRTPKISRYDYIRSPALGVPLNHFEQRDFGTHILGPVDGTVGSGPDYVAAGPIASYKDFPIKHTLTSNLAGFLGTGRVQMFYQAITDLSPSGSNTRFDATTEDSVYFRLTYYYCLTSILPADISDFTAVKLSTGNVQLNWNAPNDITGKRYELQKSTDARDFTSFQTLTAKTSLGNTYSVNYTPTREDKDKIFFRIKQFEADGSLKYSSIKTIKLDYISSAMKLYPTVTRAEVNVYFPYALKSDYRVTLTSITGQVMQSSEFQKTNFFQVPLKAGLKPGMYIVSVVNTKTAEAQQGKIIVE